MPPGRLIWANVGQNTNSHVEAPQKRIGVSRGRKVLLQGCLSLQAGQVAPMLFCRKLLDSFWACPKPGQGNVGRGAEMYLPHGQGPDDFCARN